MDKLTIIITTKRIPFAFLVFDRHYPAKGREPKQILRQLNKRLTFVKEPGTEKPGTISVVEECTPLFNSNGTHRKTQKSKLIQKLPLLHVDLQELALVDMSMIWSMATPTAEDRQTQDGTSY